MASAAAAARFPKGVHRFGAAAGWVIASSSLVWIIQLLVVLCVCGARFADSISLFSWFILLIPAPLITAAVLIFVRTRPQQAANPPDASLGSRGILARVEPVIALAGAYLVAMFFWPAPARSVGTALRVQCGNNLQELAMATYDYEQRNGRPLEDLRSPDGKPLLSWRVALLPFLNQGDLIERFRLDEPWDSANNTQLLRVRPDIFVCPAADDMRDGCTNYLLVGGEGQRAIVEAGQSQIPWTKPDGGLGWEAGDPANAGAHSRVVNGRVSLSQFPIEKGHLPDVEWVSVEKKAGP